MRGAVGALLNETSAPVAGDGFNVRGITGHPRYYVGRDARGRAALLIEANGTGSGVPLELAGIEARFAIDCQVSEPGQAEVTKRLSVIVCLSTAPGIEAYFAGAAETIVQILGPSPDVQQVREAVDQLVALFQKLQSPPRRSVTGLAGELCVLLFAADAISAITSWRIDPDERFDFVAGSLRLDVKATSSRRRTHEVSFEQANAPTGARSVFASIWIETAGGAPTLAELLLRIEGRLRGNPTAIGKLRSVVGDTLGSSLIGAMSSRFDLASAKSSLRFYDARSVPAIRPPLAAGISGLRFWSDFDLTSPEAVKDLRRSMPATEAAILPDE